MSMQHLSWVDMTALGVLSLFFCLGLFKGLFWQVSRFGILLVAYVVSTRVGPSFGGVLHRWTSPTPEEAPTETSLYLAYVLVFLGVLVSLSLVALVIQKLVRKAGLTFYDRLGGGILGTATGACVVLFILLVMNMFFPQSRAADAAAGSQSMKLWSKLIDQLGTAVPDELRKVMNLPPLQKATATRNGAGPAGGTANPAPVRNPGAGTANPAPRNPGKG